MINLSKTLYIVVAAGLANCTSMDQKNSDNRERTKSFPSVAEAAKAAQSDMLSAIAQKVDLAVDQEDLRNATAGPEISIMHLDPEVLLREDTGMNLAKMAITEGKLLVPYLNKGSVVAVSFLGQQGQEFKITGLGDRFITEELKTVFLVNQKVQGNIRVVQVGNLNATIYLVGQANDANPSMPAYEVFSSYQGHNLREPLNEREFLSVLAKDARAFREQFGDSLKKQKLVR
ncbi:MAG: hypothetical protein RLZZ370_216 [Bacteroidota bacterium]